MSALKILKHSFVDALFRRPRFSRGQSILEMSFTVSAFSFVVAVLIEGALICTRAYAVTQVAYQAARYAAVNPAFDSTTITNYVTKTAAPSIDTNSGKQLKVTVSPAGIPRTTGTPVTVTVVYTSPGPFSLSSPLLGFKAPSTFSATDTTMSE